MMLISILSIPLLLLIGCYTPGVYGVCDEPELSCPSSCTVRANTASRTSYLIKKCTHELAQNGVDSITFNVYLEEINGTITLDVSDGITGFYLHLYDTVSIEFYRIQTQILSLSLYAYGQATVYCPYDVLNYLPSVTYFHLHAAVFDRFPYLNSEILTELRIHYLILPSVVTILPSMLILPNLAKLHLWQTKEIQWYDIIPSSFDNTPVYYLHLKGMQHLHSYHFADLERLTVLIFLDFPTNFTFEENALAGLDALKLLYITYYIETNLDFLINQTFPNLLGVDLRHSAVTTLEQEFFERQKQLTTIYAYNNPFHCGCEMAWLSYATTSLGWSVGGTCATPAGLNGNSISLSSNYNGCPNQSYHCFNDTFICPPESSCVNTVDSAYCVCEYGYTLNETNNNCEDTNECSTSNNCQHLCTNTVGSYTCSCNSGYTLNETNNNCEDTNECSTSNTCQHLCTNTVGSYTCSCNSGFTLQSDLFSCVSGVSQLIAPIFLALFSLLLQTSIL